MSWSTQNSRANDHVLKMTSLCCCHRKPCGLAWPKPGLSRKRRRVTPAKSRMSDVKGHTAAGPAEPASAEGEHTGLPACPGATAEDNRLVQLLRQGDEPTFALLVDRYHGQLMRMARVFVGNSSTAEEVVQETWLALVSGLDSFEGRAALKTWLFRILINRAKTRAVREARSVPFSALAPDEAEAAVEPSRFQPNGMWAEPPRRWEEDTPEKLVIQKESLALIEQALAELPPNQRAVLTLRDVEGFESEEVCNVLQISESNQRVLLHRARSRIRSALEKHT